MLVVSSISVRATHILGGELNWECQGNGSYVFDLILYRDCNGIEVSVVSEEIAVWNNANVNSITANFISRTDISPYCLQVPGGAVPFNCGSGASGGNGTGAVERILYRSNPIFLTGNPPPNGWVFTYSSFFRSSDLTNIANPNGVGITIVAKMFNTNANGVCNDSSPRFYEAPFVVACAGVPYSFNPNAYDPNLDSLVFSLAQPLNNILTSYNPPFEPSELDFMPGFSFDAPTPTAAMSAGSVPFVLGQNNGTMSFNSTLAGNYAIKVVVQAYRNGSLVSENQLEYQVAVENCLVANEPPIVTPPFNANTSYEIDVLAGDMVSFNLLANDLGLLQNGAPQSTFIYASGAQFGANFTDAVNGCANAPCATLNASMPISNSPSVNVDFNWQTACNHLMGQSGQTQNNVPYNFVFRVQDDMCQIPAVKYVTVTVNVQNSPMPTAPELNCVSVMPNGDVTLNWTPSTITNGIFAGYQIYSIADGWIATIPDITTSTFTHLGANANGGSNGYYLLAMGGCGGLFGASSDTLATTFLTVNNPGTGFANLNWNAILNPQNYQEYAYIMMEYPVNNWFILDSVNVSATNFSWEVSICEADLNFQVVYQNQNCMSSSNLDGGLFEDLIPPPIPFIQSVSVDTTSGDITVTWDVNPAEDTYGYIIYNQNSTGFFVDYDTIWGRPNTSYTFSGISIEEALSFTVAAFDSCFTDFIPPTYQTSGKAEVHTLIWLEANINACDELLNLSWTAYEGWSDLTGYSIYYKTENSDWVFAGSSNNLNAAIPIVPGFSYTVAVQANATSGASSFSPTINLTFTPPGAPEIHYLATATVTNNDVLIRYFTSIAPNAAKVSLQKYNIGQEVFEELEERIITQAMETFYDFNAQPNKHSETYRLLAIDSCDNPTISTHIGKTIFLEAIPNHARLEVLLQWSKYEQFAGPVSEYRIYRAYDGMPMEIIATVATSTRNFVDQVGDLLNTPGSFCYVVEAVEGINTFGFAENSMSNEACALIEPLIYIPNAIIINGINELFMPVISYYDVNSYELSIMNRWGELIFRTNNPNEGWNGQDGGHNRVNEGTYVYVLRINNGEFTEITKRGHVSVLIGEKP